VANHFSAIGFNLETQDDFVALAEEVAPAASPVPVPGGRYLRWCGGSGEELWLQVSSRESLIGMHPHFSGRSSVRVGLTGRIRRDRDTTLDGALACSRRTVQRRSPLVPMRFSRDTYSRQGR
jgi:hypothetical protein